MPRNTYDAYRQQSIMTMTTGGILTTLYDAVLKELALARRAFGAADYTEVNRSLQKVQRILSHLRASLDFKYEVSQGLDALYDYFIQVAVQANIRKDPARLDELGDFIIELRDAYIQADRQLRVKEA